LAKPFSLQLADDEYFIFERVIAVKNVFEGHLTLVSAASCLGIGGVSLSLVVIIHSY